jgi:hypothetical protein
MLISSQQAGGEQNRWANCASNDLHKNLVQKIIASETSSGFYSCDASIVFFCDMLEQCLSQPETVSLTFLEKSIFWKKQSTFG